MTPEQTNALGVAQGIDDPQLRARAVMLILAGNGEGMWALVNETELDESVLWDEWLFIYDAAAALSPNLEPREYL